MSSVSPDTGKISEDQIETPSFAQSANEAFHAVRAITHQVSTIAGLEARLAGASLAMMLALALFAAVLLITTWVLVLMGSYHLLISTGFSPIASLFILAISTLFMTGLVALWIKAKSKHLAFPATRRAFGLGQEHGKTD